MNKFTLTVILIFIAFVSQSQSNEKQLLDIARQVIAESTHCSLITVDSEGRPRARVMDAFLPEENFTVWLATNPRSRKVEQIKTNSNVTLYYLAPGGTSYVLIQGEAELFNSLKLKKKYWKSGWESFYPNKRKDMILIKVKPHSMELVSYPNGVLGDTDTWKPKVIKF